MLTRKYKCIEDVLLYGNREDVQKTLSTLSLPYDIDKVMNTAMDRGYIGTVIEKMGEIINRRIVSMYSNMNDAIRGSTEPYLLYIIQCTPMTSGGILLTMGIAVTKGYINVITYMISKGMCDRKYLGALAARCGHMNILLLAVAMGDTDWDLLSYHASSSGHLDILKYIVSKGASDWKGMIDHAAKHSMVNILEYISETLPNTWNIVAVHAIFRALPSLLAYAIARGANNWNQLRMATEETNMHKLVPYIDSMEWIQ